MALREKLAVGFKNLRDRGYFVKPDDPTKIKDHWWCCMTCGTAALPDGVDNYVFYHQQDNDRINENIRRGEPPFVMLCWGGDGHEIRKCLLEAGLAVEWDGSENTRVKVCAPPLNA